MLLVVGRVVVFDLLCVLLAILVWHSGDGTGFVSDSPRG